MDCSECGRSILEHFEVDGVMHCPQWVTREEAAEVAAAYDKVVADKAFSFGFKLEPGRSLTVAGKRIIVELYEKATGTTLLERPTT